MPSLKIRSLKSRLTIAAIILVVAVALLVSFVVFSMMTQRVRQMVADQQTALLATTAGDIEQKLSIRQAALQALAADIATATAMTREHPADAAWDATDVAPQRFLEQHAGARILFDNLVLFSHGGDAIANLHVPASGGTASIASRGYFADTLRLRKPIISVPTVSMFSNRPVVLLTAPVLDADGQANMVLTGSITLKDRNFIAELARTPIGRSGAFSILAQDGTVVADRDSSRVMSRDGRDRPLAEQRALAGFEGSVVGTDRNGVRGLYSFKRLRTVPWILVAFYPESEAFGALSDIESRVLLAALAMAALIGPLVWLFVRYQLQPLQQLQARIMAIREQPTLALAQQSYAADELGALAVNFDTLMRDRLFAEARYQTSAEELRAATNSGLDAFFIFQAERDANGRVHDFTIRYLNANAERVLGKPFSALARRSLRTTLPGHPIVGMLDKYVSVLASGQALQEEVLMPTAGMARDAQAQDGADFHDGDDENEGAGAPAGLRWFLHQIVPQADGVALTSRDITDRKRDEIEIRSNRAFLQSLTDHLPMLFYAKRMRADGQGVYVTWNQAAESITGIDSADVLGRTDRDIHPRSIAAVYEANDRTILDKLVPLDIAESRFYRRDGSVRYLHVISVPILADDGRVEHIIGIGEDITERRRHESRLRTSQAELKAVNDSSPLGLFMTDLAGNCTYVNRTYERMAGIDAAEMLGDAWFRSLHQDDQEAAIEGWVDAIHRGHPYEHVHRFRHANGAIVSGSFKAVPITVDDQITGYVGSVDDITARLEAERALHASQQRLRLLTNNIPALISYVTADQRFEFGNSKYQEAYGLARADISGMSAAEVLGVDVYAQSAPYIESVLEGTAAHFERLVTHVGELRWERVSYVPDVDEGETVRGFFSLVEDITELKRAQHTFAKSEMRLRMIADNLPALIAYIDRERRYRFCNGYYEVILGLKPERILGRSMEEVGGELSYQTLEPEIATVLGGQRVSFERHAVGAGIDRHFLYDFIPDIGLDGSVVGFYSMVLDITARKTAELKQAAGERLLRTLTDNLPALVGFIDQDERFQFNNQVYSEWLNKPMSEITGRSMREVYGEANYRRYKPYFDQALKGTKVEFEFEAQRNGQTLFFRAAYAPQFNSDGSTGGVASMISDITALKKVEHQLRILARFDSLTGLPNRNQFEEKLSEAMARSSRNKRSMAVMFLDIDHFKEINDTIGHHGGDEVLREFAQRLQRCVRKTDTVSRLAGDEFTIILEGLQIDEETSLVAAKIIHAMQAEFQIGNVRRKVTTSIGIAARRPDEISAESLLRRADEALYVAKAAGRNTYESIV